MERVEIAIVGSGPAGVSAAITAKVRGKSLVLFGGAGISTKVRKAHGIRNYPGLPEIGGEEFAAALAEHLAKMDISITQKQVTAVYAMGDYFALQTPEDMVEAQTVILATGVFLGKPLPGEDALLGRGVSYCATCDAHFYRGKTVAVVGYGPDADAEAEFLAETADRVLYFPVGAREVRLSDKVEVLHERPLAVVGTDRAEGLQTDRGTHPADGVFLLRDAVSPGQLVPGLTTADGHAVVDLQMRTNLPGCFACGDLAGKPYQYIKAAGQGNVAALSAVDYLAEQKNKKERA